MEIRASFPFDEPVVSIIGGRYTRSIRTATADLMEHWDILAIDKCFWLFSDFFHDVIDRFSYDPGRDMRGFDHTVIRVMIRQTVPGCGCKIVI